MWQPTFCMIAVAALLACAMPGLCQDKPLLVKTHPRLFFTGDDLDRIKAAEYANDGLLSLEEFTLTYFGGKQVTFAFPPTMPGKIEEPPGFDSKSYGHYPYWTSLSGSIQSHLEALALSYAATGREEFAGKAAEYCLTLVGWEVWTDPDYHPHLRPCLDTGHITLGVAVAYDVCYDAWTEEAREKVREGLLRLGLRSLYQETIIPANQSSDANWDILYNAAAGIGALAIVGDEKDSEEEAWAAIEQANTYFLRLLEAKMTSPNTEGLAYSSSLDHGVRFADVLKRVTGDESFFEHPYVRDYIPRWTAYFMSPDGRGCVNFCDAGSDTSYPKPFATLLKVVNNVYEDGLSGWLLHKMSIGDGQHFTDIMYGNPSRAVSPPPEDWPKSVLMENIGWAALRSGWEADDALLGFKCSSSKHGHDHLDAGNFIINHAGTWLATDLGYGSFRSRVEGIYSRGTAGHNCILVDGGVQKTKDGAIERFYTSEALDYVLGDATACYDKGLVEKVKRHIIYVKPDYYLIYDELASAEPRQFQWLLHADKNARWQWDGEEPQQGQERDIQRLTILKPKAELHVHFLTPENLNATYDCWPGTAANYQPYMTVTTPDKVARASYVVALAPRRIAGGELTNPDFAWGLHGWTKGAVDESQVKVSFDTEVKHSGEQSVKMVGEVAERDRTLLGQWYLPATEGALYRASIWTRTQDLTGNPPMIDLTFYDNDRKHTPPVSVASGQLGTNDWQQLVIEAKAPEGAALMTLRAAYNHCAGTMWFDRAQLVQVEPPQLTEEPLQWSFTLEGDALGGAFAVRATAEGREDLIVCNFTGQTVEIGGIEATAPIALRRSKDGQQIVDVTME